MLLPILVLSGIFQFISVIDSEELAVIRHANGDIFTVEGSCEGACVEQSSGTGSPYYRSATTASSVFSEINGTCECQCNNALPVFREDLHICVSDIHECSVAGFVGNSGLFEKVPYVFLPQRGQIIYPQAEIRFEGVTTPVCGIAGSQQLGKSGWLELRNLSNAEPPFRLFRDEGRTFLQWIGENGLRDAAEGKVVVAKLVCRDASPNSNNPGVFTPCVAFRVAGSPSKSNIREVTFAATGQTFKGLSVIEYTAIGISSILLALIYVASVSLYLHSRKARLKPTEEPEVAITGGRDGAGLVKNNPLLVATRHFESDSNSGRSDDDPGDDLAQSDGEQGFENVSYTSQQVTSAIIHPHCMYMELTEGPFGTGSILGERIPDEDVRIVETIENTYQHDTPILPGTQRRKLYFNPAYFERQLLLAPPPAAIEFLMKIREVISIAKHKMSAKRFVPTLTGIPEEESSSERCSSTTNKQRAGSIQGSVARSRKSQRCTGCPGCLESKTLPQLPDGGRPMVGESRVRAWLEDVKPPEKRWKDAEDSRRNFQENARTFARSFEYLKEMAKIDFVRSENGNISGKSLSSWKDNPPMLRSFQNIARSDILEDEDRHSFSKRSTKSMFEESDYDRYYRSGKSGPSSLDITGPGNTINAKVRKAIENSFLKQMEENAAYEDQSVESVKSETKTTRSKEETSSTKENPERENSQSPSARKSPPNGTQKRTRKARAPSVPSKELPDMINELPAAKIPAKRIMDAVIKEMVDVKALEHHARIGNSADYEVDSLERTNRKVNRKIVSPKVTRRSSPKLTTSNQSDDDKIVKNNPTFRKKVTNDVSKDDDVDSKLEDEVLRRNYYNNLPELLTQRPEGYSLVSEVYVNDGYASPAGSDDSGPEIRYEPENPGHLTIKVQDSPENYVKEDESEYEPDTLDRKPMRLKINGDVIYDCELTSESYVDSLERPGHIMLRSKGSFRDEGIVKNGNGSLQRGYGSLREIYEARLRSNLKDSSFMSSTRSLNSELDDTTSWKKTKYLTPDMRQAKRQRAPQNQPDVVPLPPTEEIYQQPKPPRKIECNIPSVDSNDPIASKNELDRSQAETVDPTTHEVPPVLANTSYHCVGNSSALSQSNVCQGHNDPKNDPKMPFRRNSNWQTNGEPPWKIDTEARSRRHFARNKPNQCRSASEKVENRQKICDRIDLFEDMKKTSLISRTVQRSRNSPGKVEDSGYLSSTDSNGSQKQLLRHDPGSVSETDENESVCDGASESGAESVGTDSVFFGNFRRLSEVSNFSKSVDSGVDLGVRNTFFSTYGARTDSPMCTKERTNVHQASDSETESFVTVLSPSGGSRRNSLVL